MPKKKNDPDRIPPLSDEMLDRIDLAWDALEQGDIEAAGQAAEDLMEETEGHPEVRFLLGAALLESGFPHEAIEQLESSEGKIDSANVHNYYLASAMHELARFEEAEALFRRVLEIGGGPGPGRLWSRPVPRAPRPLCRGGGVLRAGPPRRSDLLRAAHTRMQREAFEKVVQEATETLSPELAAHLKDVPIVVQDLPEREVLTDDRGRHDHPVGPRALHRAEPEGAVGLQPARCSRRRSSSTSVTSSGSARPARSWSTRST